MAEPTEKSGLFPCPLCGGEAIFLDGGAWVECDAGTGCDFNASSEHWPRIPRQSDELRAIVGELRGTADMFAIMRREPTLQDTLRNQADRLSRIADKGDCEACGEPAQYCSERCASDCTPRLDSRPTPPAEVWVVHGPSFIGACASANLAQEAAENKSVMIARVPVHGATQGEGETCDCPWVTHPMVCGQCGKPPRKIPDHDEPSSDCGCCALPEQWEELHDELRELRYVVSRADDWRQYCQASLDRARSKAIRYLKACKRMHRAWKRASGQIDYLLGTQDRDSIGSCSQGEPCGVCVWCERDAAQAELEELSNKVLKWKTIAQGLQDANDAIGANLDLAHEEQQELIAQGERIRDELLESINRRDERIAALRKELDARRERDEARREAKVWERAAHAERDRLERLVESFGRGEHLLIMYGPIGTKAVVKYNAALYDAEPMEVNRGYFAKEPEEPDQEAAEPECDCLRCRLAEERDQ